MPAFDCLRLMPFPFPDFVRYAKQLVKYYWNQNRTEEGWRRELDAIMEITRTKDCQEGIRAFLEKRKPEFRGPYYDNPPY